MEKKFGPILDKLPKYNYKTPGTPGRITQRPEEKDKPLSPEDQTFFRITH
jgi:hypothetical protein